jgi:2-(1,2-epoxy-1,2-dihydrophenyl)acetyl-CoA isomerase
MPVVTELSEGILTLRLNRPQRLNALTLGMAQALLAAVQAGVADAQVRVLLLCAQGRAFCAGKDRDDPPVPEFVATLQALAQALMDSPKPVVAAAQGWAVGGGLELLLNCDLVLAGHGARFSLPEVQVGLLGTGGVAALLPRSIGLARAKGALLLGLEFSAAQAVQWGLIWGMSEDPDPLQEARRLARQLASRDPAVLGRMKALLHREVLDDLAGVLAREALAHDALAVARGT